MKCPSIKKLSLIFLLGPLLLVVPQIRFSKSLYYITPIIVLFTISLLLNFPGIIHALHSKPATIEDLEDINSANIEIKNRFITIFEWALTFMLAILMGVSVDYYLNKIHMSNLTPLEIMGVFGGIISLIYRCEGAIGKILLFFLKRYKKVVMPEHLTNTPPQIELTEIHEVKESIP